MTPTGFEPALLASSSKKVVIAALLYASMLTLETSRRRLDNIQRTTQAGLPAQGAALGRRVRVRSSGIAALAVVVCLSRQVRIIDRRIRAALLHKAPDANATRPGQQDAEEGSTATRHPLPKSVDIMAKRRGYPITLGLGDSSVAAVIFGQTGQGGLLHVLSTFFSMAADSISPTCSASFFAGSSTRSAYRAVVLGFRCPRSWPI